jgi:predicted RNase H-like HicB family nuclease
MKGNTMRVDYTVQIWREGTQFVAQAMPIDVVSAGSTPEQARVALDEAVGLFLSTAQQTGTLREILEECSYEHDESGWRAPEWIAVERHSTQLSA